MKKTLYFGLLLLLALPGFGQGRDSVFAVHKLFREKRAAGEGLQAGATREASNARYVQRHGTLPTPQQARENAVGNTVFTTAGVLKASRYSVENEAEVLKLYAGGWGLPADIRRKLRRKYFHRTAQDLDLPTGQ